ncbi:D-tyrosyl-tRNA(Tyr) deacylase [Neorhodopirellula lusitana]|uniref:D-aminoacyl-tRNA deacylase n=1 Tax=Neorhodopirellula lusitana TaxID=445327 RepID=A0ABY1PWA2_9BACT|nr:D-aminoacyl-tRNA deacylase [Neorhodopirellula lusitana]SMP51097.1 D-tyrosyl-tRNA(Tyr) deacylase [Neorhodopirellula lusitana]
MKVILQRTENASVRVDNEIVGEIEHGLVALVGIGHGDTLEIVEAIANKTAQLRIFNDDNGKMNRSVIDTGGGILAISQFTLLADCRKGRRPAFTGAAEPSIAKELYESYVTALRNQGVLVECGIFAADMKVSLINDGPVTIVLDSQEICRTQSQ